jgi:hypothetical protein
MVKCLGREAVKDSVCEPGFHHDLATVFLAAEAPFDGAQGRRDLLGNQEGRKRPFFSFGFE